MIAPARLALATLRATVWAGQVALGSLAVGSVLAIAVGGVVAGVLSLNELLGVL